MMIRKNKKEKEKEGKIKKVRGFFFKNGDHDDYENDSYIYNMNNNDDPKEDATC